MLVPIHSCMPSSLNSSTKIVHLCTGKWNNQTSDFSASSTRTCVVEVGNCRRATKHSVEDLRVHFLLAGVVRQEVRNFEWVLVPPTEHQWTLTMSENETETIVKTGERSSKNEKLACRKQVQCAMRITTVQHLWTNCKYWMTMNKKHRATVLLWRSSVHRRSIRRLPSTCI